VTVVLEDTLNKGERSLMEAGHPDAVINFRRLHQRAMRPALVATVEQLTGHKVIAFLSDQHLDPDIAVESFVLERNGSEPVGRAATRADEPASS
jgi:uncharacterized protein YbcI